MLLSTLIAHEDSPGVRGFIICHVTFMSGRLICTFTPSLGHGVARVLSSEMTHGTHQMGVPYFTHKMSNCCGVKLSMNVVTHTLLLLQNDSRLYRRLARLFEDGLLLSFCLRLRSPEEIQVACAGMATNIEGAHSDPPGCPCE